MNKINKLFQEKGNNILNIYFTAGYPSLNDTARIALALAAQGVDIIEIGMPYSDPLADGPVIQASSQVALQNGMQLELLFQQIKDIRTQSEIPIILMGYFNQMMQYGETRFIEACAEAGVDGLILPDLPLDIYEHDYQHLFEKHNIGISFLITPQTPENRIREVDRLSNGFIYMVSQAATTGAKQGFDAAQLAYFERIATISLRNPRLIGFGIANAQDFQKANAYAQGAIIGSAFIKHLSVDSSGSGIAAFVAGIREVVLL